MDKEHYKELVANLSRLLDAQAFDGMKVYLFGHCNATEVLADEMLARGIQPLAILDNNKAKYSLVYKGIPVCPPKEALESDAEKAVVCISARAYASMAKQLRGLGFIGRIEKIVDYDSFAEYSTSPETIEKMTERLHRGQSGVERVKEKYPGAFRLYCPFRALGDVFIMMSYLPYYLEKRGIVDYVVCVVGNACVNVVRMFGGRAESLTQREMDEQIQAVIYAHDTTAFIPHQDRPYVNKLYKALYFKKIPLEMIYKCGVFGLPQDTEPVQPTQLRIYAKLDEIPAGKSVIFSPYAKSVSNIPESFWKDRIDAYRRRGYTLFTNVSGDEEPLEGTISLDVPLAEMQSVVERAGTFIGIRSGLCDVIRYAKAEKTAVYPDVYYSDTKWKMEEMYHLERWNNLVLKNQ